MYIQLQIVASVLVLISGNADLDGRIIGGITTHIESVPYQVSLEYDGSHRCSAAILNPTAVITTGFCAGHWPVDRLKIRAGTDVRGIGGVLVPVLNVVLHEKYSAWILDYDVCIVILKHALVFSEKINAIPLPKQGEYLPAGTLGLISGWGSLIEGGPLSDDLQSVTVPVLDQKECEEVYFRQNITSRMFCAGLLHVGGKGPCDGDRGDPLVVHGTLQGINSWGLRCDQKDYVDVYTRISILADWIESKLN